MSEMSEVARSFVKKTARDTAERLVVGKTDAEIESFIDLLEHHINKRESNAGGILFAKEIAKNLRRIINRQET